MISIIGGSGFIGSRLCQALHAQGIAFEIIDLCPSPIFPERTKIADIRDFDALNAAISGQTILNLAAVHRDDVADRSAYYTTNVDGNRVLSAVADAKGIATIVFVSTVAVYGFAPPDTAEDGAINPFNDYGASKHLGEEVLRGWFSADRAGRSLTIIRPTVVFGEGNRGNVYNLFEQIRRRRFLMIGPGTNRKSMAYVGNVAAFLQSVLAPAPGYRLYNYADKPDLDMNALIGLVRQRLLGKRGVGIRLPQGFGALIGVAADALARILKRRLPVSAVRVQKFAAETSFAADAVRASGFVAPYSLQEGIERTLVAEFLQPDATSPVFYTE